MKTTPSFPPNRRVSRRHFLTGTTAGLAASLTIPSMVLAAGAQGRGGRGQDEGPALPPMQPPGSVPRNRKVLVRDERQRQAR